MLREAIRPAHLNPRVPLLEEPNRQAQPVSLNLDHALYALLINVPRSGSNVDLLEDLLGGRIPRRLHREALGVLQGRCAVTGIPAEGRCRKRHLAFAGVTDKRPIEHFQSLALLADCRMESHRGT